MHLVVALRGFGVCRGVALRRTLLMAWRLEGVFLPTGYHITILT